MLQRVVDQMLAVLGEHHTVDLTSCTWLNELDALIDLRKPCTHRSDGPLQLGVPTYRSSLVGKVPATEDTPSHRVKIESGKIYVALSE